MHPPHLLRLLSLATTAIATGQQPIGPVSSSHSASGSGSLPDRNELLSLHKSLVSIPSITGTEHEVGTFLVDYLASRSYTTQVQPIPPLNNTPSGAERFNVLAWPGLTANPSPRVLITSHIDVVPPYIPYDIDAGTPGPDTRISGRGSADAKASVAAQIIALEQLLAAGDVRRDGDAMLLFVVGEEFNGDGMRHFSETRRRSGKGFEAVVFGEPTVNKLACGHKGHAACTVTAVGKAGHSGYPWLGKSANEVLTRALVRIVDADLGSSERFGNTTVNIGVLDGGVAANVIPAHATAKLALRIAAGDQETGFDLIRGRIEDILKETDAEALTMECTNGYGPIECDCDVDGFESMIVNYGTDAANLEGDHVRYLYGPGDILVAHGDDEALTVRDLEAAVEGYKKLIQHALRT